LFKNLKQKYPIFLKYSNNNLIFLNGYFSCCAAGLSFCIDRKSGICYDKSGLQAFIFIERRIRISAYTWLKMGGKQHTISEYIAELLNYRSKARQTYYSQFSLG